MSLSRKFTLNSTLLVFGVLTLSLPRFGTAATGSFRAQKQAPQSHNVSAVEVEASLQSTLDDLIRGGAGSSALHLGAIEASLWSSFQALPKNEMGRIAPPSVRYAVRNYFVKEHGWLLQGLETNAMQTDGKELHEATLLAEKAPALVAALMEDSRSNRGLSLSDLVVMVGALEHLIFDESVALLEMAYALNNQSSAEEIEEQQLDHILSSYLLVFEKGALFDFWSGIETHAVVRQALEMDTATWQHVVDFEQDYVNNFAYTQRGALNPFKAQTYSFQAASQIVETMAHGYGKWQHGECQQMKDDLMDLVSVPNSGLVPLGTFYAKSSSGDYLFFESVDYLRKIGALDETNSRIPKVRIANYMQGPTNCIASNPFYSVCCLNECEVIMNELEGAVQAPTATPERLLGLVRNISSSSMEAPRDLSSQLVAKLNSISDRQDGQVPLHGWLFAQWMHLAFPNECPFQHKVDDQKALSPMHWLSHPAVATVRERERHVGLEDKTLNSSGVFLRANAEGKDVFDAPWSDEEVLPLVNPPRSRPSRFGSFVRCIVQLMIVLVVLRIAFETKRAITSNMGHVGQQKKTDDLVLPW